MLAENKKFAIIPCVRVVNRGIFMSLGMIIFLALMAIILIWYVSIYNNGIRLRQYVREAFSTMDVYLKKRWDLIPNLLETVKGYAAHEKGVFEQVTELRSTNYGGLNSAQKIDINQKLDIGIAKLLAVAENYPDLKANQNFAMLMEQLASVENDIANSRKYYNGTVRELNTYTEVFPSNIICAISGIKSEKMFEINEAQRENVKVQF